MPVHDWDVGTASGNFRSVLKFNAKAGRWFFKKDGEEIETELSRTAQVQKVTKGYQKVKRFYKRFTIHR